jgi:MPBQ/MSBQ methyltransferase
MPTSKRLILAALAAAVQPTMALRTLVRPAGVQLRAAGLRPVAAAARSREPKASAISAALRPLAGPAAALSSRPVAVGAVAVALATALLLWLVRLFNTPSRSYQDGERESGGINSVGKEYDAWTSEGILEYYWGEHIHLGYYEEGQRKAPFYGGKNFIEAKYDFIDKMLE